MRKREVNLPDTILFDMGGTIEDIWYNEETAAAVIVEIRGLLSRNGLETDCNSDEFQKRLHRGVDSYKKWSQSVMLEKKPEEIWPDYYLREFGFPRERIIPIAEALAQTWETVYYHREMRPKVKETLEALHQRGYKLGVISNTASLYSVFNVLEQYGIRDYFLDVTLSSTTGYRKPHPSIFEISLRQMQSRPEQCVYVGDTVSRDVIGSKKAGFAQAVQICSFMTEVSDSKASAGACAPDRIIYSMEELIPYLDQLQSTERT
ncbi:HAD family hydrolase [Anoxybacterium hadale]|uniref:HAD family hydrolase n=1 Tax=Anoxybacterium hadale TaxID=3408580 RepID=A0ACD1AD58_9FIRM|nr:HAD family hydrolase [Clostridiales bacterium]